MKTPKELFPANTGNLSSSELYFLIIKEIFNKYNKLTELLDKLGEKRKTLEKFSHFYYFICQPFNDDKNFRDEVRLIGITSLIEGMMQEVKYKDFFQWFEAAYGVNKIEDYKKIKEEYLSEFGATRKIKDYFENYISEEDKRYLIKYIEPFKSGEGFSKVDSIIRVAEFLYSMRSEFVHGAKMCNLCPDDCRSALIHVSGNPYKVDVSMKKFMKIFEKSFVLFWEIQASANSTEDL